MCKWWRKLGSKSFSPRIDPLSSHSQRNTYSGTEVESLLTGLTVKFSGINFRSWWKKLGNEENVSTFHRSHPDVQTGEAKTTLAFVPRGHILVIADRSIRRVEQMLSPSPFESWIKADALCNRNENRWHPYKRQKQLLLLTLWSVDKLA